MSRRGNSVGGLVLRRLTRTGQSLSRRKVIDEILDEVLREKPGKISAAKFLEASRR